MRIRITTTATVRSHIRVEFPISLQMSDVFYPLYSVRTEKVIVVGSELSEKPGDNGIGQQLTGTCVVHEITP